MRLYEFAKTGMERIMEFGSPQPQQAPPPVGGAQPMQAPPPQPAPGQQPPPPPAPTDEDDHDQDKKIDPGLMSQIKDHPYVTQFEHGDDDKTHPDRIASMSLQQLHKVKDLARIKAQRQEFKTPTGLYDDKEYAFYQALIRYVGDVIRYKQGNKASSGGGVHAKESRVGPSRKGTLRRGR